MPNRARESFERLRGGELDARFVGEQIEIDDHSLPRTARATGAQAEVPRQQWIVEVIRR